MFRTRALWFALVVLGLLVAVSQPAPVMKPTSQLFDLCTEDPVIGCIASIDYSDENGLQTAWFASDGEAPFDPWQVGLDTSDGVVLPEV